MRLVKPKKALGQHFLKDLQIAQRIADTLSDYKDLPVLEIGPGMGVLTQYLLEAGHDLTVVELDMESVDYLEQNFPALEGRILAEDFLRLDLSKLFPGQFCVFWNDPERSGRTFGSRTGQQDLRYPQRPVASLVYGRISLYCQ